MPKRKKITVVDKESGPAAAASGAPAARAAPRPPPSGTGTGPPEAAAEKRAHRADKKKQQKKMKKQKKRKSEAEAQLRTAAGSGGGGHPPAAAAVEDSRETAQRKLEWLLSPMTPEVFFEQYWEQKPLLIRRKAGSGRAEHHYGDLLSKATIANLLQDGKLTFEDDVDITSYTNGKRSNHQGAGPVPPQTAWNAFESGSSIRLLCPHAHCEPVWQLLSSLESCFGSFVGSNSYLTPPGTQGFAPHYDDIEAFVLQLEGKKEWKVYAPRSDEETLPRFSSSDFKPEEIGEPVLSVTLGAGDLLYFPRGWIHQARSTKDDHSLHLTISTALRNTFSDLLGTLLPAALELATQSDIDFRRSLPADMREYMGVMHSTGEDDEGHDDDEAPSGGNSDKQQTRAQFMGQMHTLLERVFTSENLPVDAAIDQVIRHNLRARLPPTFPGATATDATAAAQHQLQQVVEDDDTLMNSVVRLVRHDIAHIAVEEDMVVLYHSARNTCRYQEADEGALSCELCVAPALEYLINAYPSWTAVADLPVDEDDDMLAIAGTVSELCRVGVLTVMSLS
eukprot:SAG22_NODE_90_length_21067_cov_8.490843_2_plen_563_part_00